MAVYNVVGLREIQSRLRIEAEFYRPEYVGCYETIERLPHVKLRSHSQRISDGTHFTPRYEEDGVRFYSAVNVKEGYFAYDEAFKFISEAEHRSIHKRCPVRSGDVLLRKVGVGPRWSCVVPEGIEEFSIFVSVAMVRPDGLLYPEYLSTFINSRYGQLQLLRLNKGISQPDLHLEDIGELLIPDPTSEFQFEIAKTVRTAEKERKESECLYGRAQGLLESELGLDKLAFQRPMGYTATFSELERSLRSDAQHYQPQFAQLSRHLSTFSTRRVREIRTFNRRGSQPVYVDSGTIDVVNSQHIGPTHIDYDGLQRTSTAAFAASVEGHIRNSDLLIYTTGAHIGRTNVYLSDKPALASNHVNILRLIPGIDTAYMALVFQSIVGQYQTQKHARGSAQAELYPTDIDRFDVPLLDPDKQEIIGDLVRESLNKQRESKRLLNQAKTCVEQLIEEAANR
jgi:type I restriction enzyme, S subunit